MDIKRPLPRRPREDIFNPSVEDFLDLSLARLCSIIHPDPKDPPPRLFPLAEKLRGGFFTVSDWDEFGDLETEHGRLAHLLARYPERSAPSTCQQVLRDLLGQASVLAAWKAARPILKMGSRAALEGTLLEKGGGRLILGHGWETKSDCLAVPRDYDVDEATSEMSRLLWKRSLEEIASQLASGCRPTNSVEFLQIHAFTKDPIFGLEGDFKDQQMLFDRLLAAFVQDKRVRVDPRCLKKPGDLERVAAQAAHESSYLSNPLADRIFLIHFHAHHQLPYAHIRLASLARAEFSVPTHVLEVLEEMLLAVVANDGLACPLVPILVTACPSFSDDDDGGRSLTAIIDGNHRATASILLSFLATCEDFLKYPWGGDDAACRRRGQAAMSQQLVGYCKSQRLGKKWQIDLLDVVQELYSHRSRHFFDLLLANAGLVRMFAPVKYIPALVVQEPDFLTICKQRSEGQQRPVLLHPFHQTLFNDRELPLALPQKAGQTHGRPEGFRLLPLTPFGMDEAPDKPAAIDDTMFFDATLRKSMNGLEKTQEEVASL